MAQWQSFSNWPTIGQLRHACMTSRRDFISIGAVGAFSLLGAGCATTDEPMNADHPLKSEYDRLIEILAKAEWKKLRAKGPLVTSEAVLGRVAKIIDRIAGASGAWSGPLDIAVFDTEALNAFVLPGGRVSVHRGLLDLVETDGEFAAVIAREAALVVSGDNVRAFGATQTRAGGRPYTLEQGEAADIQSVTYLAQAGYDPRDVLSLWTKLNAATLGRLAQYRARHQDDPTRPERLKAQLRSLGYQV